MTPAETPTQPPWSPQRILFVVSSLHGGGAEFVARTWMGWLAERGHDVSVVLVSESPGARDYLPDGVRLLRLTALPGQVAKANALRALLFATKPQVAIALQTHPNLVLLAASRMMPRAERPKVVISERNVVSLGLPGASASHRAKVLAAQRLYRLADHVIAISHPVAAELIAGFGVRGERVTVVPNPATAKVAATVATATVATATVATTRAADAVVLVATGGAGRDVGTVSGGTVTGGTVTGGTVTGGTVTGGTVPSGTVPSGTVPGGTVPGGTVPGDTVPSGTVPSAVTGGTDGSTGTAGASARRPGSDRGIQIVVVCRLVPQKRPLLAIEAAAELARRGISVEIMTFGDGPLLGDLADAADRVGVDFWHRGWVENWFAALDDNAVVVLPSDREGFGNVLVEAAAAGYPAVAVSGALGVADAIVPGITGELALSANPVDLADAILRAADLPLDRALIEPWLRRFSVEASGSALESVLARTVGVASGQRYP
ncbi:glycosyltransferase [Glaciibacter sp. 2TAF33]|uniref:glycosyltransferase n=1 Tax=Glaciibacter sp. 2TAF33 TaxID=3233015 RepID=UPI003F9000E9